MRIVCVDEAKFEMIEAYVANTHSFVQKLFDQIFDDFINIASSDDMLLLLRRSRSMTSRRICR